MISISAQFSTNPGGWLAIVITDYLIELQIGVIVSSRTINNYSLFQCS